MQSSNLHPLLVMSKSEIKKASGFFEIISSHLVQPLLSLSNHTTHSAINDAYADFVATSARMNSKIDELASGILERKYGLRPNAIIRISREDSPSPTIIKIRSLSLCMGIHLSSSPNYWEWRITGVVSNGKTESVMEIPLRGKLSLERMSINNSWVQISPNVAPKNTPAAKIFKVA